MITLLSGLPGAGKSLRAVQLMVAAVKEGRQVFAFGFAGLCVPGVQPLAHINDWINCPPGSVIFCDEVQKHWRKGHSGEPIPPITRLEVHRSEHSVDLVLCSQDPRFIDPHVRRLVSRHEHRVEKIKGKMSHVYAWDECQEDPQSGRGDADGYVWLHPTDLHGLYTSAEVHTKGKGLPKRIKIGLALLPFVAFLFWYAFTKVAGDAGEEVVEQARAAAAPSQQRAAPTRPENLRQSQPWKLLEPRIEGAPWSAPAYDDVAMGPPPRLACVASMDRCTCLTADQGTRYEVRDAVCRQIVHDGIYDPTRAAQQPREAQRQPIAPTQPAASPGV